MKKLFVLGDSISIHYGPFLEEFVKGFYKYDRKGKGKDFKDINQHSQVNGGDSNDVLRYLEENPDLDYDVLLLNCGLHDIKTRDRIQVDEKTYGENLKKIIELVYSRGKSVVWVMSTPVEDERHNKISFPVCRYNRDVVRYNEIAATVMAKKHVPIIDLYSFTCNLNMSLYHDHVHYLEPVRKLHAAFVAGSLMALEQEFKL